MKEQIAKRGFLYFLNRNYYISLHLVERLEELEDLPLLNSAKELIAEAISSLQVFLGQMEEIFISLCAKNNGDECEPMIGFLENIYTLILDLNNSTPYLSLLDYLSTADALMQESATLADMYLNKLSNVKRPGYNLYESKTLQPLKMFLKNALILS